MTSEENREPTCVMNMLENFRQPSKTNKRSSYAPIKLDFGDSPLNGSLKRPYRSDSESDSYSSTKKSKLNIDYSMISSPWEARCIRAELIGAKAEIESLEKQLSKLHTVRKEMEIMFENEKSHLQQQLNKERSKFKDLDYRAQTLRKRELEYKEELAELKSTLLNERQTTEKEILSLQKENAELKEGWHQLKTESAKEISSNKQHIGELEKNLAAAVEELDMFKEIAQDLETQMNQSNKDKTALKQKEQELNAAQSKIKAMMMVEEKKWKKIGWRSCKRKKEMLGQGNCDADGLPSGLSLEHELDEFKDAVVLAKCNRDKLLHYAELEKEIQILREHNKKLKDTIGNKLLLEEQVENLKSRETLMEEKDQEMVHLQAEHAQLQRLLIEWQSVSQEHCADRSAAPAAIKKLIIELQHKELLLSAEKGQIASNLKTLEKKQSSLTLEMEEALKKAQKHEAIKEQQASLIRRLQKKLLLVSRDRDYYRSQLDIYEKDDTMTSAPTLSNSQQQQVQQLQTRLEAQESSLNSYREMVEQLEKDLKQSHSIIGGIELVEKLAAVEEERDKLQAKVESLYAKQMKLEEHLEKSAMGEINAGSNSETGMQTIHFKMNPFSLSLEKQSETMKQLKEENELLQAKCDQLKARLEVLEQGQMQDVTRIVEGQLASCSAQEVEDLRNQVKSYDLKIQRLKEAFKTTSQEYREACYMLLGYRIDRVHHNQYKLSNMYAESPNDYLMFKLTSGGSLDLLSTPYSETLMDFVELHLEHQHSIPLFLSAITVDLFTKQTLMTTTDASV
uniref:(California timema) hypothetical protein n=1 Tax=Timema californicum TaxID=61474 RepID=A0A7R9J5G9_TIMCA|nr:unnamed protein product [Timema californicum]